jgi:hypothetical protein
VKKSFALLNSIFGLFILCFPAQSQSIEAGRKIEQNACTPCHSLRLIDSQRLSVAAWGKEVNKMVGWGARISDWQVLVDYLSSQYSDAKPVPAPALSGNGVAQ